MSTKKQKYIIRLDDACPTMDKKKWGCIEAICDAFKINPLVAVIPHNKSTFNDYDTYDPDFWKKVKTWQHKGWHIALHGYDHVYIDKPKKPIVPINRYSEFAGLSYEEQYDKIRKGLEIFFEHDIHTHTWVAPAHSFDRITLNVLKKTEMITTISDGFSLFPYTQYGFLWIPQQLWGFVERKTGIWTTCLHPNNITDSSIQKMKHFLQMHSREFISDLDGLTKSFQNREKSMVDIVISFLYIIKRKYYLK